MEKLIYPFEVMRITQNYNVGNHRDNSQGSPADFPIDEAGIDTGRCWFLAPCDVIVRRIWRTGTNTVWLESVNEVNLANGTNSFVTIKCSHMEDDDLVRINVGQVFRKWGRVFREGMDGLATGNHIHMTVANCRFIELRNNGWIRNNRGAWVITNNAIRPEEVFYVDSIRTRVVNNGALNWRVLPNETKEIEYYPRSNYIGVSIVNALNELGINSSFAYRSAIAHANGIREFTGTSAQNTHMLKLLRQGRLIKP